MQQQRNMTWKNACLVVMIRPAEASDANALRQTVMNAAFKYGLPDTLYRWTSASSSDEKFSAWNIAHPSLLAEMLRKRKEGEIFFRVYYRPCGGVSTVMPEGNYFREF